MKKLLPITAFMFIGCVDESPTQPTVITETITETITINDTIMLTDTINLIDTVTINNVKILNDTLIITEREYVNDTLTLIDSVFINDTLTLIDTLYIEEPIRNDSLSIINQSYTTFNFYYMNVNNLELTFPITETFINDCVTNLSNYMANAQYECQYYWDDMYNYTDDDGSYGVFLERTQI